mgnify:FL=1|tara:strand:- start:581 stop:967 length:387 start_codon:yes stop_codon:yes gene_type:complete
MNVFGIGIDIVKVNRIRSALSKNDIFKKKVFLPEEIKYCEKKAHKHNCYSKRFAAKEAFAKALGTGIKKGIKLNEIKIINDKYGKPSIKLIGKTLMTANKTIKKKKYKIFLSLSDEREFVIANVSIII